MSRVLVELDDGEASSAPAGGLSAREVELGRGSAPRWAVAAPGAEAAALADLSDDALIEAVRSGSREHFDVIYARYFPRIYSFVYTRVRSHADCEEIVQETFIAVFGSIERYRGTSSLLAWIYGIARNLLNNHVRSARRRRDRIELVDDERLGRAPSPMADCPEAELELDEYCREVFAALGEVSPWQTEIFVMRHFENLSIPEISRRTQRSSDSVRSSLFRVKRIFLEQAGLTPGGARS